MNPQNKTITRVEQYSFDERFYQREIEPGVFEYAPSMTYILGCVYPAHELAEWRGDVGNKRADEIMNEAGEEGTFVHESIERLLKGEQVTQEEIEDRFPRRRSLKVKRCLKAFLDWHSEFKPEILKTEYSIWGDGYAGTVDFRCKIAGETYLVDWKTSKSIHPSHRVQICGYGMADPADKLALLHLGNTTKKKYSFLVLEDDVRARYENECKMAVSMFHTLNPNAKPTDETFPSIYKII